MSLLHVSTSTRSTSGRCIKSIQVQQIMLRMCLVLQYSAIFVKYNTSLTEIVLFACLCIYLPDDDLVEVETCRRVISDKLLFITDCEVFY